MLELERGIGCLGDPEAASGWMSSKRFRAIVHGAAAAAGWRVVTTEAACGDTDSFHAARLRKGNREIVLLCNLAQPIVAFATKDGIQHADDSEVEGMYREIMADRRNAAGGTP